MINEIAKMQPDELLQYLNEFETSEERFFSDNKEQLLKLASEGGSLAVREKAIDLLWDEPSPEVYAALRKWAEEAPEESIRCRATIAMGRYIYEGDLLLDEDDSGLEDEEPVIAVEEYKKLLEYLKKVHLDETLDFNRRRFALEAISFSSEDEIEKLIMKAYESPEKDMKLTAIFSMGRNGDIRWHSIIMKELNSPDEEILTETIKAVAAISLEEAGDKLIELTHNENQDIVYNAVYALGITGWSGGYERLLELCENDDEEIQAVAEGALNEWLALNEIYEDDGELEPDS